MRYWKTRKLPSSPRVSFVLACYTNSSPRLRHAAMCCVHSLLAQTYSNLEIILVHDGPGSGLNTLVSDLSDSRITLLETEVRKQAFGHPWRQRGIDLSTGSYLCLGNADNYYVPVFVEAMLDVLLKGKVRFAYCDMVHSHQNWRSFNTEPKKRRLDLAAWMVKSELAKSVKWPGNHFNADGDYINSLVKLAGHDGVCKVKSCLVVHN